MDIHFYGFLHLRHSENSTVNVQVTSFVDQVRIYASNALTLARSLGTYGLKFTLLTNDPETIRRAHPEAYDALTIEQVSFTTEVPEGIRFFSGHFKLDIFRILGHKDDHYLALVDLDVLAINPPPDSLNYFIDNKVPLIYDTTAQVLPATPPEALRKQLEATLQRSSSGRWSGGEFLAGPPSFFADLHRAASSIFDRYVELIPSATRVGNEPYQAAAIDILRHEGHRIDDAGSLGIIARYWNMPTKHHQAPFRWFAGTFLLHLPVDKFILERISRLGPLEPGQALRAYRGRKWQWVFLEIAARVRQRLTRNM